jgi:hypothetical protein
VGFPHKKHKESVTQQVFTHLIRKQRDIAGTYKLKIPVQHKDVTMFINQESIIEIQRKTRKSEISILPSGYTNGNMEVTKSKKERKRKEKLQLTMRETIAASILAQT